MTSLLDRFIPESRDYLDCATSGLLKLERNPADDALINEVFRAVHTLKGASGLFDVPGLTRLVHAGEDLLGAVRSGQLGLTSTMVDLLLDSLDRVAGWVNELERSGRLPADAESLSASLSQALRAVLPAPSGGAAVTLPGPVDQPADWLGQLSEDSRLAAFASLATGAAPMLAIRYQPDGDCFYRGEDPINLLRQLPSLAALRLSLCDAPPPLAEIDPFRCLLRLDALTAEPRAEVETLFRYVIDQMQLSPVGAIDLILPAGRPAGKDDTDAFVDAATTRLESGDLEGLQDLVCARLGRLDPDLWQASALRWLDAVLALASPQPVLAQQLINSIAVGRLLPLLTPTAAPPSPVADRGMAARIFAEQRRILLLPGDSAPDADGDRRPQRLAAIQATLVNLSASLGWPACADDVAAAAAAAAGGDHAGLLGCIDAMEARAAAATMTPAASSDVGPSAAGPETAAVTPLVERRQLARVLKVDQDKVDALMTLIAELVVSKNSLPFLAKRAEEIYGSREMSREIKDQYAVIDRLAQEMQRAILDVRMLPVSEVFERFPRLVRDLSRKLGKQIDLKLLGEDTAADKNIIEALGDPLIHLVRNAIDHGIEAPDQRLAAGKPEAATIQLSARQDGDQVVIEVSDDGKGIDPQVIRAKAIEKGLIGADQAAALSDQEAIDLIFLPGFSTASEISDLSGRGVGMDVVRTTIDKINGQVTLSSRQGEGTLVRLSLPLSMAVTRVMMVEIDGNLFGVPMDGVVATVRVPQQQVRHIKRAEAFVLRDRILPLLRLRALLDLPRVGIPVAEEAVLVARVGGNTVGLVVDRFREGIDVILKPMEGLLAGLRGYSGSAMLGDGRVLLVLNLKELL